ncbi:MAG: DUF695 domain-containing protein [Archangium sp.]|nr:DUF695 domain-containing protein [Archangium sp.]
MSSEAWIATEGIASERQFSLRFREPSEARRLALKCQVSISIGARGTSLTAQLEAEMTRFEHSVRSMIDAEDAWLAGVFSTGGSREWCFYVAEWKAFIERFNALLADAPRFALSMQYSEDPKWRYFSFLRSGFTDPT